jgi:protease-4
VDAVERGARAGLLSPARGFTSDERAALQGMIAAVYTTFVDRVGRGRKLAPAELAQVAEGRVWSGARAQQLGLVDALGGPLEALREVRRRAGLAEGERYLLDLHPRPPALSGLLSRARWWPRSAGGW